METTYILKEAITSVVNKKKVYGKKNEAIKIVKSSGNDMDGVELFIAESLVTGSRFIVRMCDIFDTGVVLEVKLEKLEVSNKLFPLPNFEKVEGLMPFVSEAIVKKIGKAQQKKNLIKKIQTKLF